MKTIRHQAGDTLVEVVFSIAIISVTLVSAFNVANNSYRIGVQSRERIEAANLAQEQAEMLRAWRDQNITNSAPDPVVPTGSFANFRVVRTPAGFSPAACAAPPGGCNVGVSGRYRLSVSSAGVGTDFPATAGSEGRRYTITVNWTRVGGTGDETAVVNTTLVDRRADRSLIDCDEVEKCS